MFRLNRQLRKAQACVRILLILVALNCPLDSISQISFQENKGQWNEEVLFRYQTQGAVVYLKEGAISFLQYDVEVWEEWMHLKHGHDEHVKASKVPDLPCHHFELQFLNTKKDVRVEGVDPYAHSVNYFLGSDPSKWISGAEEVPSVVYRDIYDHIDLIAYTHGHGFKYDFLLKPGADPNDIRLRYNYLDKVNVDAQGIELTSSISTFRENIPHCSMRFQGNENEFSAHFVNNEDGTIGIRMEDVGQYDSLIIDPEVVFATYSGTTADNFGFTATNDYWGNMYAGGITTGPDMSFDPNGRYPATNGAFSVSYSGGVSDFSEYGFACDITISKYSADGTTLLYATYIGGAHNEYPHSIVCDADQNLVIFGTTFSHNYPTTQNAFQRTRNGSQDIIVTKLNSTGAQLMGSTYLGGSSKDGLNEAINLKYFYADNHRGEVILDVDKNVYIATNTYSQDFPLKNAFQTNLAGKQDGIFAQLNEDLSDLLWASYYGGTNDDGFYSIDIDSKGLIFLSGGTKSKDLKHTSGTLGESYKGGLADGFICALDPAAKDVLRASYIGTNEYEQIFSLDVDQFDQIYVVGHTLGDIKTKGDVYTEENSGQFIMKMNPELDELEFCTLFGSGDGAPDITINAFLVDECQKIFVSGWGGKTSGKSFSSTRELTITPDAYQKTTDGSDFYLYVLSKGAKELLYATWFGGSRTNDHVDGGTSRFDKKGFIYQSICGSCPEYGSGEHRISDFPTTSNSYSPKNLSPRCSNVAFKLEFGNLNRAPRMSDKIFEVTAFDTLQFDYFVYDPDEDTFYVRFNPEPKLDGKFVTYTENVTAVADAKIPFGVIPTCKDIGDTLEIAVYSYDIGCPLSLDSTALIKIVVKPPPVVDPPETMCLVFGRDGELTLSWDETPPSHLFDSLILYRIDPDGTVRRLMASSSPNAGSFVDRNVVNPKFRNYTYYLVAVNLCGASGPESLRVSTTKEFESPIDPTYMETATVTDEDQVMVRWLRSTEEDFGSYDIWRKVNHPKAQFQYHATVYSRDDTSYIDESAKVNKESYCYQIVVNDNCGHVSARSNRGCTILLEGHSVPFKHELYWNEYEVWNGGVDHYDMSRSVDTGSLRYLRSTGAFELNLTDSALDYDWGGYWYRVRAFEAEGSLDATSQSNKIYLIQPPLLHVPNAFTPNGDNLNELWGIVPVFVKEYHVQVFTRWGEQVYDSREKKIDWDGMYKGKIEPNSVYIYTITFTGWDRSVHHRRGTVTIIQ